jgi:hypothetical protein
MNQNDEENNEENLSSLTLKDIINGIKITWIEIFNDIQMRNFDNFFFKKNRIFYIGITFILIGILLYIADEIFDDGDIDKKIQFVLKKYVDKIK